MIKTQTSEECKFLRFILPAYYTYLMKNPHSFLTHYYGMYRVQMPANKTSLHFVIMKSVFNTEREIHKIWDLKGSTKGRRANRGDSVHKDLDILEEGRKLHVGKKVKTAMMDQLKADAKFLSKLGIMDYSLLVGVHHRIDNDNSRAQESSLTKENLDKKAASDIPEKTALMRTNTPMRRNFLKQQQRAEKLRSDDTFDFNSVVLSNSASDFSGRRDDDSFSSDDSNEMTLIWRDVSDKLKQNNPITPSGSTISADERNSHPNPYTSREDLGIESDISLKLKEIYFCGKFLKISKADLGRISWLLTLGLLSFFYSQE